MEKVYNLPDDRAGELFAQCAADLYRRPGYWSLQWPSFLILGFLLILGAMATEGWMTVLLFAGAAAALAVLILRQPGKYRKLAADGKLKNYCGEQKVELKETCLLLTRPDKEISFSYNLIRGVYETKDALYLLQKKPVVFVPIPRWAFADAEDEAEFKRQLLERLGKA